MTQTARLISRSPTTESAPRLRDCSLPAQTGVTRPSRAGLAGWVALALLTAGCQHFSPKSIRGGIDVKDETIKSAPVSGGKKVYVADFDLSASDIKTDPTQNGVRGMLGGGDPSQGPSGQGGLMGNGGILSRLRQKTQPDISGTPAQQASQIVNTLAECITSDLNDRGFPAERIKDVSGNLPTDGWLIQGQFTEVNEGNRMERAIIGFGQGATSMDIQVGVSDLSSKTPKAPFAIFGTVKDPGKMPGAIATMNPYVAAAKFHMEKNATSKDIQNTADQVVDELIKFRDQQVQAKAKP